MIIANPISDAAFKWLMDDAEIARFIIATILGEAVSDVEVQGQELPYTKDGEPSAPASSFALFRLDFVATIKTASGEYVKVLIEIQKAKNPTDIMRFRNYLGEHYKRADKRADKVPGDKKEVPLHIVSIYFLGYKLPETHTPVLKVIRRYIDQMENEIIDRKEDFIEKLSHDMYVVQIPRIEDKQQSSLEQLLSIFEQEHFIDETKILKDYPYPITDKNIKRIADKLNYAGTDPLKKKILAAERQSLKEMAEMTDEMTEMAKELREKDKALEKERKDNEALLKELAALKLKIDLL